MRAAVRRIPLSGRRSTGPKGSSAGGTAGTPRSRSSGVMLPCGPLPRIVCRSIPRSRASRRTRGVALTSTLFAASIAAGASSVSGRTPTMPACCGRTCGAASSQTVIRMSPTRMISPSRPWRPQTVPPWGEGTSTTALSVSTSATTWCSLTASPSATSHLRSSTSAIPSPRSGSLNS